MARTQQDSLRVLWVGNSFTYYNDLPAMVQKIASTQKMKISCTRFLKGGERFSGHLQNKKLLQALADGGWDYVVLQEQSSAPAMPTGQVAREVYPAARTLDSLVHAASPDARVIFYMTWGHKYGNRKPVAEYPLSNGYEGDAGAAEDQLPRNGLRQRRMVRSGGYGVADGAPRASRLHPSTARTAITPKSRAAIWRPTSFSRRFSSGPIRPPSPRSFRPNRPIPQQTAQRACSTTSCC